MKKNTFNTIVVSVTSALLIILWLYASLTKLFDFNHFVATLERSPLIHPYANKLGWVLLAVEFFIAIILLFPKLQKWGLYGSAILLLLFNGYILYMLMYVPHLPCSCGGIIQKFSWKQHLAFNAALLAISIIAIRSSKVVHY